MVGGEDVSRGIEIPQGDNAGDVRQGQRRNVEEGIASFAAQDLGRWPGCTRRGCGRRGQGGVPPKIRKKEGRFEYLFLRVAGAARTGGRRFRGALAGGGQRGKRDHSCHSPCNNVASAGP